MSFGNPKLAAVGRWKCAPKFIAEIVSLGVLRLLLFLAYIQVFDLIGACIHRDREKQKERERDIESYKSNNRIE